MKNLFNSIKATRPNRNWFDLTHDVKLSLNMGELVPVMLMDCVPGDKVKIGCDTLLRLQPLVSPMMHRCDVTVHYFFVPKRVLWPNFEQWISNNNGDLLPSFPTITYGEAEVPYSRLHDYLGLPTPDLTHTEEVSAIPFAVYQKIYDDYYRDQNLIDPVQWELVDGDNSANTDLFELRRRAWQHDYFTSCLPFAQKGSAVNIPLSNNTMPDVPIRLANDNNGTTLTGTPESPVVDNGVPLGGIVGQDSNELYAQTSSLNISATGTINDLRRAYALQRWLEKFARGGSRLVETIWNMFGVKSSDGRLQRAEYITGVKSPIVISEVPNNTGTLDAPQGTLAGKAVSVNQGSYGSYYCEEWGYIMGIMSVTPKTAYQQGIEKHWLKYTDPTQEFWPDFAHIGEQEVLNKEVYAFQDDAPDTFGYVPRYAEYKYMNNRVAGDFKTSLNVWHMGREFGSPPQLNQEFIECDPTHRVFAVTDPDEQKVLAHVLHKLSASRLMPKFGTPQF